MSRTARLPSSSSSAHKKFHHSSFINDFFPELSFKEISICLQSCNINVSEENLVRPSSQFTQHLFIDLVPPEFLSATLNKKLQKFREKVSENDNLNDIGQSLPIIALQRELFSFMKICGINDFSFNDIYKPDSNRLKRILSGVVNFARFKYERSNDYQELIEISESYLVKRNNFIDLNNEVLMKIENLKKKHDNNFKEKIQEINEYQSKIQKDLKELKLVQDKLSQEHLNYKTKRNELITEIETQNENIIKSSKFNEEINTLISKIDLQKPENTKNEINDYQTKLTNLKIELTNLNDKLRKIQISIDTIKMLIVDLNSLIQLVKNISNDLNIIDEQKLKLSQYKDTKDFKNSELLKITKKIEQTDKQISNVNVKIERYLITKKEKQEKNNETLAGLRDKYNELLNSKKLKDKELEEKNSKLESISQDIKQLNNEFEEELNDTNYHIKLLFQHIELYMKKMSHELGIS